MLMLSTALVVMAAFQTPCFAARNEMGDDVILDSDSQKCLPILARNSCPEYGKHGLFPAIVSKAEAELNCIGEYCVTLKKENQYKRRCCRILDEINAAFEADKKVAQSHPEESPLKNHRANMPALKGIISTSHATTYFEKRDQYNDEPLDSEDEQSGDVLDSAGWVADKCLCEAGTDGMGSASGVSGGDAVFAKSQLAHCGDDASCSSCYKVGQKGGGRCCSYKREDGSLVKGPCGEKPKAYDYQGKQCFCKGQVHFMESLHLASPKNVKCVPAQDGTLPPCKDCRFDCSDYTAK